MWTETQRERAREARGVKLFTAEEDEALRRMVYGQRTIPGRSVQACYDRRQLLGLPPLTRRFTPEEDALLLSAKHGQMPEIAARLGRWYTVAATRRRLLQRKHEERAA